MESGLQRALVTGHDTSGNVTCAFAHIACCTLKPAGLWGQSSAAHLEPLGVSERSQRSPAPLPVQDVLLFLGLLPLFVVSQRALLWREGQGETRQTERDRALTQTHGQQGQAANY